MNSELKECIKNLENEVNKENLEKLTDALKKQLALKEKELPKVKKSEKKTKDQLDKEIDKIDNQIKIIEIVKLLEEAEKDLEIIRNSRKSKDDKEKARKEIKENLQKVNKKLKEGKYSKIKEIEIADDFNIVIGALSGANGEGKTKAENEIKKITQTKEALIKELKVTYDESLEEKLKNDKKALEDTKNGKRTQERTESEIEAIKKEQEIVKLLESLDKEKNTLTQLKEITKKTAKKISPKGINNSLKKINEQLENFDGTIQIENHDWALIHSAITGTDTKGQEEAKEKTQKCIDTIKKNEKILVRKIKKLNNKTNRRSLKEMLQIKETTKKKAKETKEKEASSLKANKPLIGKVIAYTSAALALAFSIAAFTKSCSKDNKKSSNIPEPTMPISDMNISEFANVQGYVPEREQDYRYVQEFNKITHEYAVDLVNRAYEVQSAGLVDQSMDIVYLAGMLKAIDKNVIFNQENGDNLNKIITGFNNVYNTILNGKLDAAKKQEIALKLSALKAFAKQDSSADKYLESYCTHLQNIVKANNTNELTKAVKEMLDLLYVFANTSLGNIDGVDISKKPEGVIEDNYVYTTVCKITQGSFPIIGYAIDCLDDKEVKEQLEKDFICIQQTIRYIVDCNTLTIGGR